MSSVPDHRLENELRGGLLAMYAFFIAVAYAYPYIKIMDYYHMQEKPFVYRQLSIQGVSLLRLMGPDSITASYLFFGLGGVLFFYSLLYLVSIYQASRAESWAIVLLALFMLAFYSYPKPYDMLTAAFFTLAIACLARRQLAAYLFVFFLSSINRETTIVLLPVFMAYSWNRLSVWAYWTIVALQAVTFVTVQAAIRFIFQDAPGSSIWIVPLQNLAAHWHNPLASLLSLAVIGALLWLVFRQWHCKPLLLRTAFVVLAPVLFLFYLVAGQAFEFRVFAEAYSVTALLAIPPKLLS